MSKPVKVRDQDKFIIRLPDGMRGRIKEAAKANNRSMNAEVIARFEAPVVSIAAEEVVELLRSIDLRLQALEARR